MSEDIIIILLSFLFMGLIFLIPFTIYGIIIMLKFERKGFYETKRYIYRRERKNA